MAGAVARVSTMSRYVWGLALGGVLVGALLGVELFPPPRGGISDTGRDVSAADALGRPGPMITMVVCAALVILICWLISATYEIGDGWILRKRPRPEVRIAAPEIVRVSRTRAKVGDRSRKVVESVAFTVTALDGRTLHLAEAAMHRAPRAVGAFYETAFANAVTHALRGLAAGQPLEGEGWRLFMDRIEVAGRAIPLAAILGIMVSIGYQVDVAIADHQDHVIARIPDDELLLRVLAKLGIRILVRRV